LAILAPGVCNAYPRRDGRRRAAVPPPEQELHAGGYMLRIAVIGAGRIGKIHAANVARHPRARLVAIVDPIAEAGRALAQQHGCAWKTQADALIAGDEIDAVVIASPSDTHIELIDQAAAAGKAILCEKPIG